MTQQEELARARQSADRRGEVFTIYEFYRVLDGLGSLDRSTALALVGMDHQSVFCEAVASVMNLAARRARGEIE